MKVRPYVERGYRRLTAPLRPLPSTLCIGAMRSGTSSLAYAFARHPGIAMPTRKEVQFFDINYDRGVNWYRAFFPIGADTAVDISPTYMANLESAPRAREVVPQARVLVLLRDPIERAWSLYRLRRRWGTESRSFAQAIDDELQIDLAEDTGDHDSAVDVPYLTSGLYGRQLRPWIELFGDQMLIIDSHEMFDEPDDLLDRVQSFIGVERLNLPYPRANAAPSEDPPEIIDRIADFFDEDQQQLIELTGRRFSWM